MTGQIVRGWQGRQGIKRCCGISLTHHCERRSLLKRRCPNQRDQTGTCDRRPGVNSHITVDRGRCRIGHLRGAQNREGLRITEGYYRSRCRRRTVEKCRERDNQGQTRIAPNQSVDLFHVEDTFRDKATEVELPRTADHLQTSLHGLGLATSAARSHINAANRLRSKMSAKVSNELEQSMFND